MRRSLVLAFVLGALAGTALVGLMAGGNGIAADRRVTQKGLQFAPKELAVKKGEKVVFVNDDDRTHNVFSSSDGNKFDLKAQRPGAVSEVVFDNLGKVDVRCAIHPAMRMTITVE